jgi:hypothetical protein
MPPKPFGINISVPGNPLHLSSAILSTPPESTYSIVSAKNGATEAVSMEFSSTKYYDLVAF